MHRNHFVHNTLLELQEINRSPIDGYQDLPILSLEETIEKIIPPIPRVTDYVATARKQCNRKSSLLTWDQSASIYLYSMPISFFFRLNDALRAENRSALKPWFAFLKLFTSALEKLPSIEKTIWRGVQGNVGSVFADGDVHIWWSITSCSLDLDVVKQYLDDIGTLFAIDTIHGKDISAFSTFSTEKEIVLMPGTRLRAKSLSLNISDRFFLVPLEEEKLQSDSQSESNHLFEKIRQQYRENASVERIMNPAKSIPIEHSYINLAIVETREQQQKERKLDGNQLNEEILGTFEEIYGVKTSIDVRNIFDKCHDYRKQVLIFGRAGIGKTTFCQYVTFKWATGAIWQQYQLIVFIRLRSLTESRYPPLAPGASYSPLDLIKKEYFHYGLSEKDERLLKEQIEKSRVLWLLDGYDEIIQNVPAHLQYLFEQLLKMPHHILSSRPYLNTLSYHVQLEITGFTDDNIKQYVKQFFEQTKDEVMNASFEAQKLLRFLKSNRRIWGIAHIPVNLELLCSFWCNIEWPETTALTMTNIYDTMIEWLCRRHLEKQNISPNHLTKEAIYEHCPKELAFLESLAFHGMKSNSIILRPELLQIASNESDGSLKSHPHLLNIGILKSLDYKPIGTRIQANKNHYFVHLSFQEYFAAQYIIKTLNRHTDETKETIDFIKSHKYNQRFELVFTFASGLLIDKNDKQSMNLFWDAILGEPLDLIGVRHVQLVIACMEETNCNRSLPRFHELMKSIIEWIDYFVSKEPDHRYTYLKASLRRSPLLVNQPEILDTVKMLHHNEDSQIRRNAYFLISGLPILNSHLDLTSLHLQALNDGDQRVQTTACEALEDMDEKVATAEVIDRLVYGIETSTNSFAESATKILVKVNNNSISNVVLSRILMAIGKRPYTTLNKMHERSVKLLRSIIDQTAVSMLVMALKDSNDFVRCGACGTCACMAEELQAIEVIDNLVALVSDKNDMVRQSACYALGIVSNKEANIEVLDGLALVLSDINVDVKCSACDALGRIGEKAANTKVIETLVTMLQDVNEDVKCNVCETLGRIGEKAATKDVISSLITAAVGDHSDKVRHSAYNTIGKIAGSAATIEVINCLRTALQDVNPSIRCTACDALGRIGEKAASSEPINILVNALQDVDDVVKCHACEALGMIGEKAATTEVFNGLTTILQDENQDVRYSACIALEQMGEKLANMKVNESVGNAVVNQEHGFAVRSCDVLVDIEEKTATDEVIIRLVSILEDNSYNVRSRAHEALEKICTGGATKSIISKLIAALAAESPDSGSSAYFALHRIGKDVATTETIDSLIGALENPSHYVKDAACRILAVIAGETVNIKMINSLIVASTDTNEKVRESACSTLGKLGEKAASANVINSLITAFGDKNQDVRCSAYIAVGQMGSKAATTEVINNLVTAVGDEIDKVSQSACYALGEIGEKAVSTDAINCLVNALRHPNPDIRHNACEALGKMKCQATVTEVIKYCLMPMGDENDKVRESACQALGKIGEKTVTNQIVSCLTNAVFDKNLVVKSAACDALEKIGKKAATNKVIDSLLSALEDHHIHGRRSACETLQRIVEKVETVKIINKLVELVKNDDPLVRSTACSILSKVSEADVTDEMIDCLVNALGDKGIKVPFHAYEALQIICERGVNNRVVNRLETALQSRNYEVRAHACQLLSIVGEKTVTNELISILLDACFDEYSAVRNTAGELVERLFYLSPTLSFLTHDTVSKLSSYVSRFHFEFLWKVSPDRFVKSFLDTEIVSWLPIIKTVLLRQGYGITVTENTIVLYSSREPLELPVSNRTISERLRNGLLNRTDETTEMDTVQSSGDAHEAEPGSSSIRRARKRAYPFTTS